MEGELGPKIELSSDAAASHGPYHKLSSNPTGAPGDIFKHKNQSQESGLSGLAA